MLSLEIGQIYKFTLVSGRCVEVAVSGSTNNSSGTTSLIVNVNGVDGEYRTLNDALGEPFVKVTRG
jgi:hypothetical protein